MFVCVCLRGIIIPRLTLHKKESKQWISRGSSSAVTLMPSSAPAWQQQITLQIRTQLQRCWTNLLGEGEISSHPVKVICNLLHGLEYVLDLFEERMEGRVNCTVVTCLPAFSTKNEYKSWSGLLINHTFFVFFYLEKSNESRFVCNNFLHAVLQQNKNMYCY